MLKVEPTERFSSRVEHYVRYRPSYPAEVIIVLRDECGLTPEAVVADIASGTGLFTRLLLENGNRVFGVEPNENMRRAGEEFLTAYQRFVSVAGTAEATRLPDQSIDLITSAQAGHWFDRDRARAEFLRILRPGGFLALIWNERRIKGTEFEKAYEELVVQFGIDYQEVQERGKRADGDEFFAPSRCELRVMPNYQELDYEGLEGRLLSSSYVPQPGHASYNAMLAGLRRIFDKYQQNGIVRVEYDTRVFFGRLS
jgi:SAM-dependent methyltransferase